MSRRLALLVGLLAVATAAGAGVVAAHGNHATAGPQVSANGTVVVEQVFLSEPGYVALAAEGPDGRERVVGVRSLDRGLHHGVRARIDAEHWRNASGTTTVGVRLYGDDGDGTFDPGSDPRLLWFDRPAGATVPVRKGPAPVSVVSDGTGELGADGTVTVRSVTLAERGHVVVHAAENDSLGAPLGHRTLDAGRHTAVPVPVPAGERPDESRHVVVAVHRDDGDGTFDPGSDPAVRVGGAPVATDVTVRAAARDPVRVNTPTATPTPASTPTADGATTPASATGAGTADGAATTGAGAGFGVPAALVALAVVALLAGRRG